MKNILFSQTNLAKKLLTLSAGLATFANLK